MSKEQLAKKAMEYRMFQIALEQKGIMAMTDYILKEIQALSIKYKEMAEKEKAQNNNIVRIECKKHYGIPD
jgi:hypothetical protein